MQSWWSNDIFLAKTVHALCWMLVHSLWLGLILTIVTGTIMLATKERSAALRYKLLSGALLLFMIAVLTSFVAEFGKSTTVYRSDDSVTLSAIDDGSDSVLTTLNTHTGFFNSITGFLNTEATWVVCCWFFVIIFRAMQFAGGMYTIKKLKTTQLTPVSAYWQQRLQHFAAALEIKKNIHFMQSGLAKVPMVVGHFKPMVLFPLGLLMAMPAEEVEAVLLHELAHIRRKDYLVNLLQHFMEILFFFNPAVLWVSGLIKTERENCCDDMAVLLAGNKRNYINALVSFQEYHLEQNLPYATALGSNKNQLLKRVKRMLYNNNKTLTNMEKTFLAVCFTATTLLAVFFNTTTAQTKSKTATNKTVADNRVITINNQDALEDSTATISEKINGINYTLSINKKNAGLNDAFDGVAGFTIEGKPVPSSDWGKYKAVITRMKEDNKKLQAEAGVLKLEQEKLNAESMALLDEQEKLKAESKVLLDDTSKYAAAQLELLVQQDKLKAEQKQLMASQDKYLQEQQTLKISLEKLKEEKRQLQQEAVLQKNEAALNKLQSLKMAEERKQAEADMLKHKAEMLQLKEDLKKAAAEQKAAMEEQKSAAKEQKAAREQQQAAKKEMESARREQAALEKELKASKEQQQD